MDRIVLFGRVNPQAGPLSLPGAGRRSTSCALPHYPSLAHPLAALRGDGAARCARFWRSLDDVDAVWLLGPHLLAIGFAVLAALRGKKVFLGVRQDLPRYVESRHPGKRWMTWAASVLEGTFRLMARRFPVVVVGPQLAANYSGAGRLLAVSVSLVGEDQIVDPPRRPPSRGTNGELRILTVGRLETEKNPLLLADVLARLHERDPRFRLLICGEGPMAGDVEARLRELGVADHADLLGYVPIDGGLLDLYRSSHAFLHVSWTEGLPQTLFEAFASGLPVVATAVGGVPAAVGDAALLVEPGDADPPAAELLRIAGDEALRRPPDRVRHRAGARQHAGGREPPRGRVLRRRRPARPAAGSELAGGVAGQAPARARSGPPALPTTWQMQVLAHPQVRGERVRADLVRLAVDQPLRRRRDRGRVERRDHARRDVRRPSAAWPGMSLATTGGAAGERLHDGVGGALGAAGRHEHVRGRVQRAAPRRSARARAARGPGSSCSRKRARRLAAADGHADGLDAALAQRPHGLHEQVSALAHASPSRSAPAAAGRPGSPRRSARDLALLGSSSRNRSTSTALCRNSTRARGAPRSVDHLGQLGADAQDAARPGGRAPCT